MNLLLSILWLYGLIFLCVYLPYKCGYKKLGLFVGITFSVVITIGFFYPPIFMIPLFLVGIIFIELIFIIYWTLHFFGKRRVASVIALMLSTVFVTIALSPWIVDFLFNKKDVMQVLLFHHIELIDDFTLISNSSTRVGRVSETFTIQLTANDYRKITDQFLSSPKYKGNFERYIDLPASNLTVYDTIDYETPEFVEHICFSSQEQKNGINHFQIKLNKATKELQYIGSIHY